MSDPLFSFIIVTYHNEETIELCLTSIAAHTRDPYEVVVIDNSSNELTGRHVSHFKAANSAVAILFSRSGGNIGFGRACNAGANLASGHYLFFLNPDTRLENDAAGQLAKCFEANPLTAAVGPAIMGESGHIVRTCRKLPNVGRVLLDATGLDRWCGAYKLTRFPHDSPRRVEQIIGAAMLIKRSDYQKVGGMDQRFFMYFEEVDLCKRLGEAGCEIWFWPSAAVRHQGGHSSEETSARARMIYVLRYSRAQYFRKHFGATGELAMKVLNRFEGLEKAVVFLLLSFLRPGYGYREKARGFWAVVTGDRPPLYSKA